ncbi:uncharacterized protein PAN0_003c1492 [Moesziomyces antarcticus]|uniref:Stealth protein CR3 conserved region 3 domain-containing protein n=1 Tax=Pseudozyma antarctica TaxID=84753 RepID=A0A5C3FI20_PSEA2|nr:uncharacterized protein PAN0_003c1492 [Moesziomyces antarcticus]GAK63288.1 conserved hypothetical protein [Moesziomyces antarcticus]SPO43870.1 uncharacterized protein PSANT_01555 [Moesziomyces antarcticus]
MLRYLRPLTEPFSSRYRQYLPLPTSSPRGSVSAQGDAVSTHGSAPGSPSNHVSSANAQRSKARVRRRSLSWHLRLLLLLAVSAFALHAALRHFFFPAAPSTEASRAEALAMLTDQLAIESPTPASQASANLHIKAKTAMSPESVHRVFADGSPGAASREVMPIRAYDALSDACIEQWVVHHRWGDACRGTDMSHSLRFDAVWAWVNGSDPAQILARNTYKPSSPINVDAAHRYADHNELLYSMRSLYHSFGGHSIGKMHIMASAYPLPQEAVSSLGASSNTTLYAGQIPYWLNASSDTQQDKIQVHHDAAYFRPMQLDDPNKLSPADVDAWRAQTLPSFNSLAVESQLFNVPGTSSDQLVYLNDDFFTMVPNEVSDLSSALFGPVIKSDTRLFSFYRPSEHPFQRHWNPAGEEVGIKRAAWILGQRFPMRSLPYITHHPRTLSLPLLREAAQTFPEAFSNTTLARFRAQKEVPDSIQAFFLASWYIVERHREALLWSWAVAKWGGRDGVLDAATKRAMWDEIRMKTSESKYVGTERDADTFAVSRPVRRSRDQDRVIFEQAGVPAPKNTEYSFSSHDGHALSYLDWTWPWQRSRDGYPDLSEHVQERGHARSWIPSSSSGSSRSSVCRISYSACFAPQNDRESADALFKRIAFAPNTASKCGDCIMAALLTASGEAGISAFLPPHSALINVPASSDKMGSRSHLPLTESWRATDFSLNSVLHMSSELAPASETRRISLRTWCTRLIQRYQYVLGATPSTFYKVEYASRLPHQLEAVDRSLAEDSHPTTFLCLNDDIKESSQGTLKLNRILKRWFAAHWSRPLPGELGQS